MSQVSKKDVQLIQKNIENVIGVLMKVQNSDYNEAEKLSLFITSSRVLGRVGLWCTTLNHNYLHTFLWRCSYGYYLDLDLAIDYLLKYAMEFLNETEIMADRILGHSRRITDAEDLYESPEVGEFEVGDDEDL